MEQKLERDVLRIRCGLMTAPNLGVPLRSDASGLLVGEPKCWSFVEQIETEHETKRILLFLRTEHL